MRKCKTKMTIHDIAAALEQAGLKRGRVLSGPDDLEARNPSIIYRVESRIVRNAAVATRRHGIVWQGDIDIRRERYILRKVAVKIGANLFVIDEPGATGKKPGPSPALILEAVWWTCIAPEDRDQFFPAKDYDRWHPQHRRLNTKAFLPPGKNWESKVIFATDVPEQARWRAEISSNEGQIVAPALLQRSGPYELVWFSHGQGMLQPAFHTLKTKFGRLQYTIHSDKQPIHVQQDNTLVALIWPSPVPNAETVASARLELALRTDPPQDRDHLKAVVLQLMHSARCQGAEELHQATVRLTSWLEGSGSATCTPLSGVTEWHKCGAVEYGAVCFFKGTKVPTTFFSRS